MAHNKGFSHVQSGELFDKTRNVKTLETRKRVWKRIGDGHGMNTSVPPTTNRLLHASTQNGKWSIHLPLVSKQVLIGRKTCTSFTVVYGSPVWIAAVFYKLYLMTPVNWGINEKVITSFNQENSSNAIVFYDEISDNLWEYIFD